MLPAVVELQAESDHRSEVGVRGAGSVYKHHVRGQFLRLFCRVGFLLDLCSLYLQQFPKQSCFQLVCEYVSV